MHKKVFSKLGYKFLKPNPPFSNPPQKTFLGFFSSPFKRANPSASSNIISSFGANSTFLSRSSKLASFVKSFSLSSLALLSFFAFVSNANAYTKDKVYRFTVVSFSDTHGHFLPDSKGQGGLPAIKTAIDKIRAEGNPVLVLYAGDYNQGTPESDIFYAKPDMVGLNAIGLDALTPGSKEFAIPLNIIKEQKAFLKTEVLSANVFYRDPQTGIESNFFKPYTIINKGGLNFLIVGLTNPDIVTRVDRKNIENFTFSDPYNAFIEAAKEAEKDVGFDVVISLDHLGFYPLGRHGDKPYGTFTLAQKLPSRSVNLFVTSSTHNYACVNQFGLGEEAQVGKKCIVPYSNLMPINPSVKHGRFLGRADFEFKNGLTTLVNYRLIPINVKEQLVSGRYVSRGEEIKPDAKLEKTLQVYREKAKESLNIPLATIDTDLPYVKNENDQFATISAIAQKEALDGDLAIVNSGAYRNGIKKGEITFNNLLAAEPFNNLLTSVNLTGEEIKEYIEIVLPMHKSARPVFAGITFDADRETKKISNLKINGQAIEMDREYKLVVSSYLAYGGDGYPDVSDRSSFHLSDEVEYNAVKAYLLEIKHINIADYPLEGPTWID